MAFLATGSSLSFTLNKSLLPAVLEATRLANKPSFVVCDPPSVSSDEDLRENDELGELRRSLDPWFNRLPGEEKFLILVPL